MGTDILELFQDRLQDKRKAQTAEEARKEMLDKIREDGLQKFIDFIQGEIDKLQQAGLPVTLTIGPVQDINMKHPDDDWHTRDKYSYKVQGCVVTYNGETVLGFLVTASERISYEPVTLYQAKTRDGKCDLDPFSKEPRRGKHLTAALSLRSFEDKLDDEWFSDEKKTVITAAIVEAITDKTLCLGKGQPEQALAEVSDEVPVETDMPIRPVRRARRNVGPRS